MFNRQDRILNWVDVKSIEFQRLSLRKIPKDIQQYIIRFNDGYTIYLDYSLQLKSVLEVEIKDKVLKSADFLA